MANDERFGGESMAAVAREVLEPVVSRLDIIVKNTSSGGSGGGNPGAAGMSGKPGTALSGSLSGVLGRKGFAKAGAALGARGATSLLGAGAAGGPVGIAAAVGASAAGAVKSAIFEPATKILKDTVFNGLRSAGQFGGEVNPFSGAFAKSLKNIPLIGEQATGRVINPINRAGSRTAAITSLVARGGGQIDPTQRQALFDRFVQEERRAEDEAFQVEKLAAAETGSAETRDAIFQELNRNLQNLSDVFGSFIRTGSGPRP